MDESLLVQKYPVLYHMAEPGAWPSIQKHGLLSTEALLDLVGASAEERTAILSAHRKAQVSHRGILIRDQKPMNHNLASCLQKGIAPGQWLEHLNRKVFFWTTLKRLQGFRAAYPKKWQLILEVPTLRMVKAYQKDIRLCHINSGATRMPNHFRTFDTFTSIADFEYSSKKTPVEFTVAYAVKNIRDLASAIYEDGGNQGKVILYINRTQLTLNSTGEADIEGP